MPSLSSNFMVFIAVAMLMMTGSTTNAMESSSSSSGGGTTGGCSSPGQAPASLLLVDSESLQTHSFNSEAASRRLAASCPRPTCMSLNQACELKQDCCPNKGLTCAKPGFTGMMNDKVCIKTGRRRNLKEL